MKGVKILFYFLIFLMSFTSCNKKTDKEVNTQPKNQPTFIRFDKMLFEIPVENLNTGVLELRNKHPEFFDLFTQKMIRIGSMDDTLFFVEFKRFITDTTILNTKTLVEQSFNGFDKIDKEVSHALEKFKEYFPGKKIPKVYACISGFNQSVVIAEGIVGISLDKYLGPDCPFYEMLGLPNYMRQKMIKQKIPIDLMYGIATTEFLKSEKESNLLSYMIYEGKLLYFIDKMFPKTPDSLKIGYSDKQLMWCKKNESQMWTNLVENKRLYATGRMDIKRLIDDSPYTNGFPIESPGKTGVWIGWQIVRKYMEKHPEVTLAQLMSMDDPQKILNDSKYFP